MGMDKVMRVDRTVVEIDSAWMHEHGPKLGFVQASNGIWLPACDQAQYERGERPERSANGSIGASIEFTVIDSDAPEKAIRALGKIHEGLADVCRLLR